MVLRVAVVVLFCEPLLTCVAGELLTEELLRDVDALPEEDARRDEEEVLLDTVVFFEEDEVLREDTVLREEDEVLREEDEVLRDEDWLLFEDEDVCRDEDVVVRRVWAYPSVWNAARAISIAAIAALLYDFFMAVGFSGS